MVVAKLTKIWRILVLYGLCPIKISLPVSSVSKDFWHMTATAGSDVVQSGRPIFDDFFQHLWPYIGNNTANVVFQMVKRLWLIRIDQ
ncbi:adhesion G protein-coupled receptor B2 [Trichonephila clavipes]|nr:adhesion G protein-coupled receptor B2 [Trichonephila clavipes]